MLMLLGAGEPGQAEMLLQTANGYSGASAGFVMDSQSPAPQVTRREQWSLGKAAW